MTTAVLDVSAPVYQCDCHEPGGVVRRSVYPLVLTLDNLKRFWSEASQFRSLFGDAVGNDFKKFCEILMSQDGENVYSNGLFWLIDDWVGVFYMTHIQDHDAQIHYTFFDRRHHGRQVLTRKMIQFVFKKYGFRRMTAEIPYWANGTFEFVEQVGLKFEGRKRKAAVMNDEWFDVRCFGVLREEAEAWG